MHGGDIYENEVISDFSVNLNPQGVPASVMEAAVKSVNIIQNYPDIMNRELKKSLSGYFKLPYECVAVGNGASELIMAVFNAIRPERLIIPAPDFSGYLRAAEAVGCEIEYVNIIRENYRALKPGELIEELICRVESLCVSGNNTDDDEKASDGTRADTHCLVMLTNPNNPLGHLTDKSALKRLLETCRKNNFLLGVDESFMPFVKGQNDNSLSDEVSGGNLIIFRSFTKLFSMPGLRLGALLADMRLVKNIEAFLPEWNISSAANAAGLAALKESEYISSTPEITQLEREYLEGALNALGIRTYPSAVNYILGFCDMDLYTKLLSRGILIRDCSDYAGLGKGFYRFAVRNRQDNKKLITELKNIME